MRDLSKGVLNWWKKNILALVTTAVVLFASSGKPGWIMAWFYLAGLLLVNIANARFMGRDLMAERSRLQKDTQKWDIALSVFVALVGPLFTWLTAGLDARFGWSGDIMPWLQFTALMLVIAGGLLGTWSMAENRFFSATVRVQSERDHRVAKGGPYKYIRHPGYAGGIIAMLMTPVALGSWVALIPGALVACGFILRTILEDRFLQEELPGYRDYAGSVRCRLFPGVW
jgi:protein-S-isoprenylcysteine O-methyltransferase Ste14